MRGLAEIQEVNHRRLAETKGENAFRVERDKLAQTLEKLLLGRITPVEARDDLAEIMGKPPITLTVPQVRGFRPADVPDNVKKLYGEPG